MADATTIRQRLLARAFLYDDPDCYAAGVVATLCELTGGRDADPRAPWGPAVGAPHGVPTGRLSSPDARP